VAAPETLDIAEFTAHLRGVLLPIGLRLDDIRIYGRDLHLVHPPFSAEMPAPGRLEAIVHETSLAAFLEAQSPAGLKDFRVEARDGKLVIRAVKVVIVSIPATAICRLRIEDGQRLFVDLESVEVGGGASIKTLVQNQLDRINPIIDAKQLPMVKANLTGVTVENGAVIVSGEVTA
jgi:hypothetical protein